MSGSARGVAALAFLVLLLPGAAAAHVTVTPRRVAPGAEALLAFSAPNEREHVPIEALTVDLPAGFVVGAVETKGGWRTTTTGRTVTWRGGRIPPGQFAQFFLRAVSPGTRGSFATTAVERFADGQRAVFHPRVSVGTLRTTLRPGTDSGARTLGKFALGVALAAALLAVGAGFLALRSWLVSGEADGRLRDP